MPFETSVNNCTGSANSPWTYPKTKNDHLETDTNTWDEVLKYIPKTMVIWQPFYMNGNCATYVRSLGYTVIHEDRDFFTWEPPNWDIIVDNPPYSIKKKVFDRCNELGKPYVLLLPLRTLSIKCIRDEAPKQLLLLYSKNHHFKKMNGEYPSERARTKTTSNPIDPTWYFFKIRLLPTDIVLDW
jgi:hypothetical protein